MSSNTMSPSIWSSFGTLFGGLTGNTASPSKSIPTEEERRAERDFINEMIWNNPDAFSSEVDVQHMMNVYPGRY